MLVALFMTQNAQAVGFCAKVLGLAVDLVLVRTAAAMSDGSVGFDVE